MLPRPSDLRSSSFHVSQTPPGWVVQGYGEESYAGESVTVEGALSVTAVLSGFTILMEDTASLPLITYRRLQRGKERAYDHPIYRLLHDQPNPEHTSMVYREFIMGHLLGWGNHYSQLIWDRRGVLRELWPLRPDRMKVDRVNGKRRYTYTQADGTPRIFRADEIWHVPAFGFDGLMGYSRITLARNAIGLSLATEKYGSRFFANGANPGLVVKHPGALSDNAYTHLQKSWEDRSGADNAHKPVILEENMSIDKIGIPPDDAQFLETRKFQVDEIARMFRIPPHMLGATEKSTSWGTGIEQQELGYLSHTLRPWLTRIEQQAHKDLLLDSEKPELVIEHLVEDLLRTDIAARMTAYVQAITNGIMTRNEVRERENLNPMDGLDEMLQPLNLTTVGQEEDQPDPEPEDDDDEDPEELQMSRLTVRRQVGADIEPFVLDMTRRIARREATEVLDAVKRWLEKGKTERFLAFLEQFYKSDQPEFVLRTLAPLMEFGPAGVDEVVQNHLENHALRVFRAFQDGEDLQKLFAFWQQNAPEQLKNDLLDAVGADRERSERKSMPDVHVTINQPAQTFHVGIPPADGRAEQQPPIVNVTNQVNPTPITVVNEVTPAQVIVENQVEAASVTVQPADVTVNVPQQAPPVVNVNVPKPSVSVRRSRDGKISGLEPD